MAGIEGEDIDFAGATATAETVRDIRRYDDFDFLATSDHAALLLVAVSVDASGATVAEPFELWTVAR